MSYNILNKKVNFQGSTQGTIEDIVDTHEDQVISGSKDFHVVTGSTAHVVTSLSVKTHANDHAICVAGDVSASVNISASAFYADGVLLGAGAGISFDGSTANGVLTFKDSDEATVESNLTFDGSVLAVAGNIEPDANNTRNLGSASKKWANIYGVWSGDTIDGGKIELVSGGGITDSTGLKLDSGVSAVGSLNSSDKILIFDADDSDTVKRTTAGGIAALAAVDSYGTQGANKVLIGAGGGSIAGAANLNFFGGNMLAVTGALSASTNLELGGTVRLDGVVAATPAVANDKIYIFDADDNLVKTSTFSNFSNAIAGDGLVNNSGVLDVGVSGAIHLTSDKVAITGSIAGDGLSYAGGVNSISGLAIKLNNNSGLQVTPTVAGVGGLKTSFASLLTDVPDPTADSIPFIDSSGDAKCTIGVFLATIAGSGIQVVNSQLTAEQIDIDSFAEGTVVLQTDNFIYSNGGTEKRITFSNIEDEIFSNIGGDATIAAGGTLTISANAVEGSMINSNAAGGGLAYASNAINLDLNGLAAADVAVADDFIAIVDANDSNTTKKESIADLISAVASTGLDAAGGQLSVDVSDFMTNGSDNRIVTAVNADSMNAEANLTFDGNLLTVAGTGSASRFRTNYTGTGFDDVRLLISGSNTEHLFQIMQQGSADPTAFLAGESHSTFPGLLFHRNKLANGGAISQGNLEGAAGSHTRLTVRKTSIADNTATDIITFTVPNANHAASIRVTGLANFDGCAYARVFSFEGVISRASGSPADKAFSSVVSTQSAGITPNFTVAAAGSANTGANSASQTFTLQLTIDTSDGSSSNATIMIELINFNNSGITMAAS